MFGFDPANLQSSLKDEDGFVLFDPNSDQVPDGFPFQVTRTEIDPKDLANDPDFTRITMKFDRHSTIFFYLNIALTIMNIGFITYWMSSIAYIDTGNSDDKVLAFENIVFVLMIVHSIWVFNFFMGYNFLRYEYLRGIVVYFGILMTSFAIRVSLNVFLLMLDDGSVKDMLQGKFNVDVYVMGVTIQTAIDLVLALEIFRLYQLLQQKARYISKILSLSMQEGQKGDDLSTISTVVSNM